jgi:hypothetical protein
MGSCSGVVDDLQVRAVVTAREVVKEQAPVIAAAFRDAAQEAAQSIVVDQGPVMQKHIEAGIREGSRQAIEDALPRIQASAALAVADVEQTLTHFQWTAAGLALLLTLVIFVLVFVVRWARKEKKLNTVLIEGIEKAPPAAAQALKQAVANAGGTAPEIDATIESRSLAAKRSMAKEKSHDPT